MCATFGHPPTCSRYLFLWLVSHVGHLHLYMRLLLNPGICRAFQLCLSTLRLVFSILSVPLTCMSCVGRRLLSAQSVVSSRPWRSLPCILIVFGRYGVINPLLHTCTHSLPVHLVWSQCSLLPFQSSSCLRSVQLHSHHAALVIPTPSALSSVYPAFSLHSILQLCPHSSSSRLLLLVQSLAPLCGPGHSCVPRTLSRSLRWLGVSPGWSSLLSVVALRLLLTLLAWSPQKLALDSTHFSYIAVAILRTCSLCTFYLINAAHYQLLIQVLRTSRRAF